jgi:hypothetical protein
MQLLTDDGAAAAADDLVHTRSAIADLEQGLSPAEARKAQSERKQLRAVEAELSELRAECVRRELLRGPSGRRCGGCPPPAPSLHPSISFHTSFLASLSRLDSENCAPHAHDLVYGRARP